MAETGRRWAESAKEIEQRSCALLLLIHTNQFSVTVTRVGPVFVLCQYYGSITRDKEEQKQDTAQTCKMSPFLLTQLPLQKRYEALVIVDEGHDEIEEEESVQVFSLIN